MNYLIQFDSSCLETHCTHKHSLTHTRVNKHCRWCVQRGKSNKWIFKKRKLCSKNSPETSIIPPKLHEITVLTTKHYMGHMSIIDYKIVGNSM